MTITKDDFGKIWSSTSSIPEYTFSDTDYKNGWEFVDNLPPTRAMWDTLQRNTDEKNKYLYDNSLSKATWFDDVAEMKGSSEIQDGMTACTKGYATINDRGGAIYNIRVATSGETYDNINRILLDNGNVAELISNFKDTRIFNIGDFAGDTNEDKLHNALNTITKGFIFCGDITVTKSFDVAQNVTDYRQVTIVGANILIDTVPMFVSSKPNSLASADNSVPSFSNCYIKGNNSTMLFGAFNVITTKFDSCKIVSCPLFNSATHFMQSLFINNTDILLMHADMVTALRLYNFNMANSRVEWGNGKLFYLYGENGNSIANGSISNCLIEGRTDSIIYTKGGFLPLVIENCYFEGNALPYINVEPTIAGTQANLFVHGNYLNLDNGNEGNFVFKLGTAKDYSYCLIENNSILKTTAGTVYMSDAQEMSSVYLKRITNSLPSNVRVTRFPYNFEKRTYRPVVVGSTLVVEIPINKFENLWMSNMVLDIDFFGMMAGQGSVVASDYIHLKVALLSHNGLTVSPFVVSEFKTSNDVSVTPTVINHAYNSKNGILKLEFSGFNTSNITYSICKVTNNNLASQWEV